MKTPLDVVCHSRGGLVLSWLLRMQPVPVERAVFVGSPPLGTSLAAPDRLRAGLDMLANYAELVAGLGLAVAPVMPIASGVAGLAKILGKALRLGSGLPVVDAAVALVPGLATQQHVANNLDLRQLFADDWLTQPDLSGIGVAFMATYGSEERSILAAYQALRGYTRATEAIYPMTAYLRPVSHFFLEQAARSDAALVDRLAAVDPTRENVGVMHVGGPPGTRGEFSLYVPEYYDPARRWPLVVALHGGSGNGGGFKIGGADGMGKG